MKPLGALGRCPTGSAAFRSLAASGTLRKGDGLMYRGIWLPADADEDGQLGTPSDFFTNGLALRLARTPSAISIPSSPSPGALKAGPGFR